MSTLSGCLDMLAIEGHFTFVASSPQQLSCAAFIIGEPSEVIGLELSDVNIDCDAGDFIKVDLTRPPTHTWGGGALWAKSIKLNSVRMRCVPYVLSQAKLSGSTESHPKSVGIGCGERIGLDVLNLM